VSAQILQFPDRRQREIEDMALSFLKWREAQGLKVVVCEDAPAPFVSTRELFDDELSAIGARTTRLAFAALVVAAVFIAGAQVAFQIGFRDGLAMRVAPVPMSELSRHGFLGSFGVTP
jgi:hypothetical protein